MKIVAEYNHDTKIKMYEIPGSRSFVHGDVISKQQVVGLMSERENKFQTLAPFALVFYVINVVCFCFMFDIIFIYIPRQMDQMKFMGPYYEHFVSI